MGFSDKTPQYPAWLKFIDAISPKQGNKKDEVVNLTSPTDEEMAENNNDILLIKENKTKKNNTDAEMRDDEEHTKQEDETAKEVKEAKRTMINVPRVRKTQNKNFHLSQWTLKLNYYL